MMNRHLLVVGGNGFVGSAVCKVALAHSWKVSSLSPSGSPFHTPAGHRPAWTSNVDWQAGSALHANSYRALLPPISDVVVAVGTLFENKHYKRLSAARSFSDVLEGIKASFSSPNPLVAPEQSYEALNKNAALTVLSQFLDTSPVDQNIPRTFTFLSAEDFGRPFIPVGYIKAKREAESQITDLCSRHSASPVREILVRPGVMYHAHLRPLTSPMAGLLDLSATIHGYVPRGVPSPSKVLRALASLSSPHPSSASELIPAAPESLAKTLEVHPLHVDQVALAICKAITNPEIRGVVNSDSMRTILASKRNGTVHNSSSSSSNSDINH